MATKDEIFDPNDLDSIDALLDEAELDALIDKPPEPAAPARIQAEQSEPSIDFAAANVESVQDNKVLGDGLADGLLDSLDDLVSIDPVANPVASAAPAVAAVAPSQAKASEAPQMAPTVDDSDDFLSKRAAAKNNPNLQMTADDMDAIKKLIIIFGSLLVVLVLTAIGIGVWSALAASSAGIDEETQTLIESVKVTSDANSEAIKSADTTIKSVEKKLDAINFQLEQLSTDLLEMTKVAPVAQATSAKPATLVSVASPSKGEIIDPLGLGVGSDAPASQSAETKPQMTSPVAPVQSAPVVSSISPAMLKKLAEMNKKAKVTQAKLDEVNARLKRMQGQYDALLLSVKKAEKHAVMQQLEQQAAKQQALAQQQAEKAKVAADKNAAYQYKSADGGLYDQAISDSYP